MVHMVYIAITVFFLGLAYKLMIALLSTSVSGTMGTFPRSTPRPVGIAIDAFLAPAVFRADKKFWFIIILFHVAFFLLLIGHVELIREFASLQFIPHEVMLGGGIVGLVLIASTLYFLFRRFHSPFREISNMEDYVFLILLFLTMVIGSHLHLAARYGVAGFDIPLDDYRVYLSSILSLAPVIPDGIAGSPHYVLVALHIFLANLVLIFFPFTKMVHSIFAFAAHNIARR